MLSQAALFGCNLDQRGQFIWRSTPPFLSAVRRRLVRPVTLSDPFKLPFARL